MKGYRTSDRKGAKPHADGGCHYSRRPVLHKYVDLAGLAADKLCKLPACRAKFAAAALAEVDAAQAVNDATASSRRRWAVENTLAGRRLALVDDDTRTRHEARLAEIREHLYATTYTTAA